ncbi:mercuric reductase [Rhizosaccharibacter radicis]|uniref:Mercuric reductase n=1 Tax=Rhizosaccharibacter radicis TaxID=2782605 RepID=A0ABT1VXQ8_9PROT|nr:mercuric reductase [Acetobacteraceae bacterium KSS12]
MRVDVAVIGAGQAGTPLARGLAEVGRQVALIERTHLGGSCVNFGCTPSKAMIASARIAADARHAADWGISVGPVRVDFAAVMRRARGMAAASRGELDEALENSANPTLVRAHARLDGREGELFRVRAGDGVILAREVVLDVGTRSLLPPIDGLDGVDPITAENWIDLERLPRHLLVMGGSYIGLELAQAYRRLGAEITVVQNGPRLAEREDEDVSDAIRAILEEEGIRVLCGAEVRRAERTADGVRLVLADTVLDGSDLLVAVGRKPNTDTLGLDTVGVRLDDKGLVEVDERLSTSVPGIWAAGDIRGGPAFTHTAYADHSVLMNQIAGDRTKTTQGRIVPYAMFLDPELGRVGLSEKEAREKNIDLRIGRREMKNSGKAQELGKDKGFIKVLVDGDSNRLVGAACLCERGSDVVQLFAELMNAGAPAGVMRDAIHIHPTIGEAAKNAVVDALS